MNVILLTEVADLGGKGDIVDVSNGYARNYLLPKKMAMKATSGAIKQADKLRQQRIESEAKAKGTAEELARNLVGSRVVIAARSGDEGKLFGSVGTHDIAEAVKKFSGVDVPSAIIHIPNAIKEIGLHEVTIKPHEDVEFSVTLDVIPA
ncbi:MAG: 50S ribosomal protein L9 [Acidimicrobiia bacterium]|nr:50S ribosomal protein L9 [Acidimicrobiia bacterium]MDX2467176.1 50S ribosomal protein L9 [Acidimicrobiia bacterium]